MQQSPQDRSSDGTDGALLTAADVQRLLDVDKSTVYRMAGDGRLPGVRVGRQWRFPAHEIEARFGGRVRPGTLDPDVAREVLDVVARSLGVMLVLTDLAGRPLTPVLNATPRLEEQIGGEAALQECLIEWRELAQDLDLAPRLVSGRLGFECARTFVRSGSELVAMVVAGGIAPEAAPDPDLHQLDTDGRRVLLDVLPRVGALLARTALNSGRIRT